jgi:hypothetical protein
MALSIYPESARDLAGSAKADAADMARQAVRVFRDESDSIGAMAHDPVARDGGWHHCANWQSHVPRDRDHRLSRQWRRA